MRWLSLTMLILLVRPPATAQRPTACGPTSTSLTAAGILARADSAMQVPAAAGRILHWTTAGSTLNDYQSDRTYPPFFSSVAQEEGWYEPATGALRSKGRTWFISGGPFDNPEILSSATAAWAIRDTASRAAPTMLNQARTQRALLAWPVIRSWRTANDAVIEGSCTYRDYPRLVLVRGSGMAHERLFLDPKTGFPVKLERREPHYLWGSVLVEYVWSNWQEAAGTFTPGSAFRMVDGTTETSLVTVDVSLLPRDSAPSLTLATPAVVQEAALAPFLEPTPPDTVRVGPTTFLLRNRGYTQAIALRRDTVFVFDATQGEARARADSSWIARVFPGPHPIVLVVTDLAWPHVAGVRFWVARGATVVSHRAAEPFLKRVVERRWTETPDLLEQMRRRGAAPRWRFRAVESGLTLAGGDVVLAPIDGITSEVALLAWLPSERFLWASDYIQGTRVPSSYTSEVRAAVRRAGFTPERFAAQHLTLTPWSVIEALYPGR
jgi:hypothetical protein